MCVREDRVGNTSESFAVLAWVGSALPKRARLPLGRPVEPWHRYPAEIKCTATWRYRNLNTVSTRKEKKQQKTNRNTHTKKSGLNLGALRGLDADPLSKLFLRMGKRARRARADMAKHTERHPNLNMDKRFKQTKYLLRALNRSCGYQGR